MLLVEPDRVLDEAELLAAQGQRVGVLLPPEFAGDAVSSSAQHVIAVPDSAAQYAQRLYEFLHDFDRHGCEVIVASLPALEGIGSAIADRLGRAAGPRDQASRDSDRFNGR
ncbi:hypothetical protein MRI28_31675 [Nocardiopsis dassonvillei]|uniref:Sua5 family C-terminal domain-containing protein n=1 Tax=Nocardiopsis dassonvillei TaxID=2014 RepID=UPI002010791B|nr:Sua5 family C-terminal domain-containing protein [Nocardiopsis dassonvillei]MCK9874128.1 hypothetical protein [Nocardiopsis dassonvillei]